MMKRTLSLLVMFLGVLLIGCATAVAVAPEENQLAATTPEVAVVESPLEEETAAQETETEPENLPESKMGAAFGVVRDENGPVGGAIVRLHLTGVVTTSAEDGTFTLPEVAYSDALTVTAWAENYYVGGAVATELDQPVEIVLKPHYTDDNLKYDWFEFNETNTSESCAPCHTAYDEWKADAHSQAPVNPRFVSIYLGTDVHGNTSPVEYDASGRLVPPARDDEYFGPGYKLDYPDRYGNCASCHNPVASKLEPSNTCGWSGCHTNVTAFYSDVVPPGISPVGMEGIAGEGIACDFCHKIGEVILDPDTGLPYSAKPGISSMKLYRPEGDDQLFFGTFDDVMRRVTYLPLLEESAYCAPCHYGVFGGVAGAHNVVSGVEVYNSYGEWLDSAWSDPQTGATCQDCHMPRAEQNYFVFPDQGGYRRDYKPVSNHLMRGINDLDLMQNALTMESTVQILEGELTVSVAITNDKTGHHVPTGVPYRHMILLVSVTDAQDRAVPLKTGTVLPEWIGDYQGRPGAYFAKLLRDDWTGETPTSAYWRDVSLAEDTRIAAFETAKSEFVFQAEGEAPYRVEIQLLYRRAYQQLMEWKDWDDADILMEEAVIEVNQ
jgi:hypothetical protein